MGRTRNIGLGDITPAEAAQVMGLELGQFEACLPALLDQGFPPADPTTGNYALDAITVWRQGRFKRPVSHIPGVDAHPPLK